MGKCVRIVTKRMILFTYVCNAKGRGLLASTIKMVNPSGVETPTEETSEATVVSRGHSSNCGYRGGHQPQRNIHEVQTNDQLQNQFQE